VTYFKISKISGYIFHLHLVTKCDNVERSAVIVKLLRLNYSILQDHALLGRLWSQLTVWTTRCPSANQNTTAVLTVVLLAERFGSRLPVDSDICPAAVKHKTRVLHCCSVDNETQC
jgi:hypothetical protein